MNEKRQRHHSLFKKIIIPLVAVLIIQSAVFFFATCYGGVSDAINQNAEDVLTERVINQKINLETQFTTRWTNFYTPANSIAQIYQQTKEQSGQSAVDSPELQKQVLEASTDTLVAMLRSNEVTGVFLILNDEKTYTGIQAGEKSEKYGVCIRDYSPTSEYTDREDLLVERCPSAMVPKTGCSMDTWWNALFTFDEATPGDYFYKPLKAAFDNPDADRADLAYFDGAHNFGGADRTVVSYSIPLMDETGYPYAVLGVELTTDYLKQLMPASALYGSSAGYYALVQYEEGSKEYRVLTYDGVLYQQCFGTDTSFPAEKATDGMLNTQSTQGDIKLCGSISELRIYNHNTPFENQKVALVGMVRKDSLYQIDTIVRQRLLMVSLIALFLGIIAVLFTSRQLTKPINKLSRKVRGMDGTNFVQLDRLNIDEIDDLVESIEGLNDKVSRAAVRTEFFSRMSHDMRTPMNAIIGFSSPELLETADDEQLREYMRKIHDSGSFLLTLINEVLDMSKIETQRMELREEAITQQRLLAAVVPIITEISKERGVHFEVEADKTPTSFYGDIQRLEQILMNLLSNAVKFTSKGGMVRLEIKELLNDNDSVTSQMIVTDNGCGMSEEYQKKMYEPFSQEGNSSGGTGLGLAITKQMVLLMGGTISCDSEPGRGTTFTVRITNRIVPKELVQAEKAEAAELSEESRDSLFKGKRVLVCEDHPLNAQIARRLLERKGILVEEAKDGAEGVRMFACSIPDYYAVILMDIRMPNMNGLEAAAAIRRLDRVDAARIPIIAMTANAFKEDVDASKEAGMNEHLSKPIDPKILYTTLERYLMN